MALVVLDLFRQSLVYQFFCFFLHILDFQPLSCLPPCPAAACWMPRGEGGIPGDRELVFLEVRAVPWQKGPVI